LNRRAIALAAALLPALLACGELERSLAPAADTRTIVYNIEEQPRSIDPALTTELISGSVIQHVFEGLTNLGPNVSVEPGVAERWDVSEDGLQYDFYLRDDSLWSDGLPVTAHDFVYSWTRVLTPETGAYYYSIMTCIEGAEEFYNWDPDSGEPRATLGIEAITDHHLRVRLTHPVPFFLQLMAFMTYMPVRQDIIEEHGRTWELSEETYIGNGVYRVSEYERDYMIGMELNPTHRDRETTQIENLVWYMIPESQSEYIAYLTNSIDITYGVPYPTLPEIRESIPEHLQNLPWIGIYYVSFNHRAERPAFQDPRVRRAFALALDRARIGLEVTEGTRRGAVTFVPPGVPDADYVSDFAANSGDLVPNYQPDEARRLLAEAGYPNGEGFPDVAYIFNTSQDHARVAEMMQAAWRRELNVNVRLENMEWQVYLDNRREGNFDFGRGGWLGDYVDPMTFLDIWMTNNSNNRNHYSNLEFDRLIEQAWQTRDREEYFRLCHEAERSLLADGAAIPVYYYSNTFLQNPAIEGLMLTPMGVMLFHDAHWNLEMLEEAGL
jgi:oligopeptide transport system substrate-binding protein